MPFNVCDSSGNVASTHAHHSPLTASSGAGLESSPQSRAAASGPVRRHLRGRQQKQCEDGLGDARVVRTPGSDSTALCTTPTRRAVSSTGMDPFGRERQYRHCRMEKQPHPARGLLGLQYTLRRHRMSSHCSTQQPPGQREPAWHRPLPHRRSRKQLG